MDTMRDVTAENGIDAFITKRHDKRVKDEGRERPKEESYEQNLREHNSEVELSVLFQWRDFLPAKRERRRRTFEALDARDAADLERVEAEIDRRLTA